MSNFIQLFPTVIEMLHKHEHAEAFKLIDKRAKNIYIKLYMDELSGRKAQLWQFIIFY